MKAIGKQVKEARLRNEMSQQQLAEKARISLSSVQKIETGRMENLTIVLLDSLSKALNQKFDIYST